MLVLNALAPVSQAQSALKDRITQAIDSSNMSPLAGTVHPMARPEFDQGLADNAKVIQGMTINFKRSEAQEANLQALLQAQQTPGSASYHKWLTPVQFGQQFGMSAADVARVSGWLQQQGFTITSVSQSSNAIGFSGNIAMVEKAFQTQIHNYRVNGETHFANATQISLPNALAGVVSSVRGLNDFRLKQLRSQKCCQCALHLWHFRPALHSSRRLCNHL
jgi:subtilase family serine protease